jgi:ubiquinone/menaquinone biosynthesis C-methylase UbiE
MPVPCNPRRFARAAPVDLDEIHQAIAERRLPRYAETMAAFHRAFAPELRAMIASIWPAGAKRVLDLACGDGCYSVWLAEQAGEAAEVYAVDVSREWLDMAQATALRGAADRQQTIAADALRLPFAADSIDLVWCAQSLYSLPAPDAVLREAKRVLCPGGRLALMENDSLHQLLLPWPPALELRVRAAEMAANERASRHPDKFYVGRALRRRLADAGFGSCDKRTYASNRGGPLSGDVRQFVVGYLQSLRRWVKDDLAGDELQAFDRMLSPGRPECFFDDPHVTITSIDHLVWGEKPASAIRPTQWH